MEINYVEQTRSGTRELEGQGTRSENTGREENNAANPLNLLGLFKCTRVYISLRSTKYVWVSM
jgi:hypothetical protein